MSIQDIYKKVYETVEKLPVDKVGYDYKEYAKNGEEHLAISMAHNSTTSILVAITNGRGFGALQAMVNARDFIIIPKERGGIKFKFSGNPEYNMIEIYNNYFDLINVRVFKQHNGKVVRETETTNIFISDLKTIVEQTIGLHLTLF